MIHPDDTAYVRSHHDELRSEAEQERLAALGRRARRAGRARRESTRGLLDRLAGALAAPRAGATTGGRR